MLLKKKNFYLIEDQAELISEIILWTSVTLSASHLPTAWNNLSCEYAYKLSKFIDVDIMPGEFDISSEKYWNPGKTSSNNLNQWILDKTCKK